MTNVTISDSGSGYIILVDGLIVAWKTTLGEAWKHLVWMHRVAGQSFTVGNGKTPVKIWIERMIQIGYLN